MADDPAAAGREESDVAEHHPGGEATFVTVRWVSSSCVLATLVRGQFFWRVSRDAAMEYSRGCEPAEKATIRNKTQLATKWRRSSDLLRPCRG